MSAQRGYRWLLFSASRPDGADAAAAVRDAQGRQVGVLASWPADADHPRQAMRVDARAIDPNGEAAWASLAIAQSGMSIDFDEPAVIHSERLALAGPPLDVVSTLIVRSMRFAGAISAIHGDDTGPLGTDPFAAIFRARLVRVEAGLLGTMPWPIGPGTQRYGAGNPWPWDRFISH